MKNILLVLVLFMTCHSSYAQNTGPIPNLLSDGQSFVPPGCLSFPPAPSSNTTIIRRVVPLLDINSTPLRLVNVGIRLWRVRCADGNTIIVADFENIDNVSNPIFAVTDILVSSPSGAISFGSFEFVPNEFTNTANGFPSALILNWWQQGNSFSPPLILTRNTFADFIVGIPNQPIDIDDLQGEIIIDGEGVEGSFESFIIPPADQMNAVELNSRFLTGRHSGNWVVEDTSDQGVLVSVGELPNRSLVLFLAWFTFDSAGNPAWFTGNSFFEPGDTTVNFNLGKSTDGFFNEDKGANRQTVGSGTIEVIDCSRLRFSFNLSSQGLGTDTVNLVRLFAGETAGYTCRDIKSRVDELSQQ